MASLCRVLAISSLAYDTTSSIAIEFTTAGRVEAPRDDGYALCFSDPSLVLSSVAFQLQEVQAGGDQFTLTSDAALLTDASLWSHRVDTASLNDVLSSDPFFATSYRLYRYDDWHYKKQDGLQLRTLFHESPGPEAYTTTAAASTSPPGLPPFTSANCFLVSAAWKRSTRYQVTLHLRNPVPPQDGTLDASAPRLWLTPLRYIATSTGGREIRVAGASKYGAVCTLPEHLQAPYSSYFDACVYHQQIASAVAAGDPSASVPASADNAAGCVAQLVDILAGLDASDAQRDSLPFSAAPFAPAAARAEEDCGESSVWSTRAGGECVSCLWGSVTSVDGTHRCECQTSSYKVDIGTQACSSPLMVGYEPTTLQALSDRLCQYFVQEYNAMLQSVLPSEVVATEYLPSFAALSAPLIDLEDVLEANRTHWARPQVDSRRPDSATRSMGVLPECSKCQGGLFMDERTDVMVPAYDWRYLASHVFKVIGTALRRAGYACPTLYDTLQPDASLYGPYNERPCADLPAYDSSLLVVP